MQEEVIPKLIHALDKIEANMMKFLTEKYPMDAESGTSKEWQGCEHITDFLQSARVLDVHKHLESGGIECPQSDKVFPGVENSCEATDLWGAAINEHIGTLAKKEICQTNRQRMNLN